MMTDATSRHHRALATWAAIATIISAAFGGFALIKSNQVQNVTNNYNSASSDLKGVIEERDQLKKENAQLIVDIAEAKASVPTQSIPGSTPSTSTPVNLAVPPVRHQGKLEVAADQSTAATAANLDAPEPDPNWSRIDSTNSDGVAEGPALNGSGIFVYTESASTGLLFLGTDKGSYARCAQAQNYGVEQIEISNLDRGTQLCVRTSAGRYALLTVTKEATTALVVFDVIVWQKK